MNFDYTLYPGRVLEKIEVCDKKIEPIISIITPFFNSRKYIEETAKSVLSQTYPYFEWIIVDDGSNDQESLNKLEQISKMDIRIKVFHKDNSGLAHTRDFGVEKSSKSSKYVVFLDDDDVINKTFLECAYWTLETNIDASWAYVDTVNFSGEEFLWQKWFDVEKEKKENLLVATAMVRKEDFLKVNGYELREKSVFEDWNLWLKMLSKGMKPVRMNFLGFWYRRKPKNESELIRSKNNNNSMKYVKESASKIISKVEAIQYPKQDYNWHTILENIETIVIPKLKENDKIKILMIIPWMITGGADKFNLDLIKRIDKKRFEIIAISTLPSSNEWRQLFEEHATVYDLTTFLDQKYWISFLNYIIEKYNIDIIFNTNSRFGYVSLPYLKVKHPQIPIMDYVHMEEWYNRNGGFSRDSSIVSSVIDKTYVCNKNSENVLVKHFNRKNEEISTVYIGVDEKKFNPDLYNKNDILNELKINKNEKFIISYICRIAEQKRPYLLLEIIKELKKKRNDFLVIIAGDGPMLKEIKFKVKELKINDLIKFLGNITQTEKIYAISDLTINCSIKEGLALTSYESLSMGVPVISSNVGGQKDLINNDVGCIVTCMQEEKDIRNFNYKKEEIDLYVEGINKILNDSEKYKENCRKRILDQFTIDSMIKKMENIFIQLAQNPNSWKIENAMNLRENIGITKELITYFFEESSKEYEWLVNQYNLDNVDRSYILQERNRNNYENTLQYKLKHPIVVFLRKLRYIRILQKTNRKRRIIDDKYI